MKPDRADPRADALLRLERTRMQWVLRSAGSADRAGNAAGVTGELAMGGSLNAVLTEWLTAELTARLWPEPSDPAACDADGQACDTHAGPRPTPPSQVLSQAVSEWATSHPWLSVLAGLLAGSLAMSQRQRLLRWAVSAALPWLASNAAVLAAPLLTQWLVRPPPHPTHEAHAESDAPPAPSSEAMPPPATDSPQGEPP